MSGGTLTFVVLISGVVWLALLLATDFNAVAVSAGLLVMLSINGSRSYT